MNNVITFSVTDFFDPYGDGKSDRKVLSRKFYHTDKTKQDIEAFFKIRLDQYYNGVRLNFKPYKKTVFFNL